MLPVMRSRRKCTLACVFAVYLTSESLLGNFVEKRIRYVLKYKVECLYVCRLPINLRLSSWLESGVVRLPAITDSNLKVLCQCQRRHDALNFIADEVLLETKIRSDKVGVSRCSSCMVSRARWAADGLSKMNVSPTIDLMAGSICCESRASW